MSTAQPPQTSTQSTRHNKNTEETIETSGVVLMISNAGRIVCAVVWAAPETIPSASPRCTMSVPKYDTEVTTSRARSTVMRSEERRVGRGGGAQTEASPDDA